MVKIHLKKILIILFWSSAIFAVGCSEIESYFVDDPIFFGEMKNLEQKK